jgi:hypothetical protein
MSKGKLSAAERQALIRQAVTELWSEAWPRVRAAEDPAAEIRAWKAEVLARWRATVEEERYPLGVERDALRAVADTLMATSLSYWREP